MTILVKFFVRQLAVVITCPHFCVFWGVFFLQSGDDIKIS